MFSGFRSQWMIDSSGVARNNNAVDKKDIILRTLTVTVKVLSTVILRTFSICAWKNLSGKLNILQKSFSVWLRWKSWCTNKSKMQQTATETDLWMNNDVYEACDFNIHWSLRLTQETKNSSRQKHQICVAQWGDCNVPQINTWINEQEMPYFHCVFYIAFRHLRFGWHSYNYVILLHPLLLQWLQLLGELTPNSCIMILDGLFTFKFFGWFSQN